VLRELSLFEIYNTGGEDMAVAAAEISASCANRAEPCERLLMAYRDILSETGLFIAACDRDYNHFEAVLDCP